jgi:hypothetical protein
MAIVNIICENDADLIRGFTYQYASGAPVNLTGNTLRMGVRRHAADIEEQLLLTTENGGFVIDGVGHFTMTIQKAALSTMATGDYDQSLVRMKGGATLRIWSGTLTVNAGPSR